MKVSSHVKFSGILGLGVYAYTGEFFPSAVCFLSGWLVDVDHFLDWLLNFGPRLDYARILNNLERTRIRRAYVIFHGWEYVIGFLAFHILYGLPPWAAYAALGYTSHLTLDQIFNGPKRYLTYFLTYRILHRFNTSYLLMRGCTPKAMPVKEHAVHAGGS